MTNLSKKVGVNRLFTVLFSIALILFPVDYIEGLPYFGELSRSSSFYVLLPLILISLPMFFRKPAYCSLVPELRLFIILMSLSMMASFAFNWSDILDAQLRGRDGINKNVTTTMAFFFCMGLTVLTARLSQYPDFYRRSFIVPVTLSLVIAVSVAIIELLGRQFSFFGDLYFFLSSQFRSATLNYNVSMDRLKGISAEPSTMAVYFGYAFVCSYIALGIVHGRLQKNLYKAFMFLSIAFSVLATARTAYVLLVGTAVFALFLPYLINGRATKNKGAFSIFWTLAFLVIFSILVYYSRNDDIAEIIVHGDSVSNLSRYASNYTSFSLFFDNPIWGIGFGQYAFQAREELPVWAWSSREIINWFTDPTKTWPSTYSTPARLAAELGIMGVLAWYLPILHMFRKLIIVVRNERVRLQRKPVLGVALLFGMVYVLLYNVSQEGFRHFEAWIILGLVSSYIATNEPESFYGASANASNRVTTHHLNRI